MDKGHVRLITLPVSLYNEYARWGLEHAGIPYEESRQPLVWQAVASRLAGGRGTTPVLLCDGEVVPDSAEIVEWADRRSHSGRALFPGGDAGTEARDLVRRHCEEMGPECRRLIWTHLITDVELADRYWTAGVSPWKRRAQPWLLRLARPAVRRRVGLGPDTLEQAPRRIRPFFDEVAERLSDGRPYLLGGELTAADICFACMASPVTLPQRGFTVPHPALEDYPEPLASVLAELRAHPAGQFGLRLFAERAQ